MSRYVASLMRETRSRARRPLVFGAPRVYEPVEEERPAEIAPGPPAFAPWETAQNSQTEYKSLSKQAADVSRRDFERIVDRESIRIETIVREAPTPASSEPRALARPKVEPPLEIPTPRETWEPLEIINSNQAIAPIEPPSPSQRRPRQREIVRVAAPAPESIEISIGKIEVTIDAEPKPAVQMKPLRAQPAPPKHLASRARLALQYLDR